MSARSIAQYAKKHPPVLSLVDEASQREKTDAYLREVETLAPVEAKKLRFAVNRYNASIGGPESRALLYRAAMALADAMKGSK